MTSQARNHQWRLAMVGLEVYIPAMCNQHARDVSVAAIYSPVQRRAAIMVRMAWVGPGRKEEPSNSQSRLFVDIRYSFSLIKLTGCTRQCRMTLYISQSNIGPKAQQ